MNENSATQRRVAVGQHYLPERVDFQRAFDGILERRFFANNGPLLVDLDRTFAARVGAKASVAVTNETIAFAIVCRALGLTGTVAVPANANLPLVQGVTWGGAKVRLVDVDADDEAAAGGALLDGAEVPEALAVVLSVHRPKIPERVVELARSMGIPLIVDASMVLGATPLPVVDPGVRSVCVYSFQSQYIVNGGEGAVITTDDALVAERARFCRSFHAASETGRVSPRINGKMAEAPAALIGLGLADLERRIDRNRALFAEYRSRIGCHPSIRLLEPPQDGRSNYSALGVDFLGVDCAMVGKLGERLDVAGYELLQPPTPRELWVGSQRNSDAGVATDCSVATAIAERRRFLPLGAAVEIGDVQRICEILLGGLDVLISGSARGEG